MSRYTRILSVFIYIWKPYQPAKRFPLEVRFRLLLVSLALLKEETGAHGK